MLEELDRILFSLYYAGEWIIRIVMLCVVSYRRRPTTAMAWLLLIFFFPWLGLAIFLMIGRTRAPGRRMARHDETIAYWQQIGERFVGHPNMVAPDVGDLDPVTHLVRRLGRLPALGGNAVELLDETDAHIERLVEDIENATKHVHAMFYIFSDDAVGRRVGEALACAAERGVTCRLIVDGMGSGKMLKSYAPALRQRGVAVVAALPISLLGRVLERIDLRNHRKLVVIDGLIAHTGSRNIVDPSYGRAGFSWHDLVARVTGPVVLELQALFVGDWYSETGDLLESHSDELFVDPEITGDIPAQLLPSGPTWPTENYQRLVVAAMHAAREHIIITTPYLIPDEAFLQGLHTACLQGVQVDIVVPKQSDQVLVGAAQHSYFDELLEYGVNVHLHTDGLLHAKTMSVDHAIAFFGSSNFDIRSFALNFELSLVFYGAEETDDLRRIQMRYIEQSELLTKDEWAERPKWRAIGQNVARLVSPLL
jgi:cardiolipin synthase